MVLYLDSVIRRGHSKLDNNTIVLFTTVTVSHSFGSPEKLLYLLLFIEMKRSHIFFFKDRISLYSLSCPGTHSVDQAGLKLRNPLVSASQVLRLKACATTARLFFYFLKIYLLLYLSTLLLSSETPVEGVRSRYG